MATCQTKTLPAQNTTATISGEVTGEFRPAGLTIGGRLTFVTLSAAGWTALPLSPLASRNAMSIQNVSGVDIKIDYLNTEPTYKGLTISSGNERFYSISDTIIIYAKAASGTPEILIEEIA